MWRTVSRRRQRLELWERSVLPPVRGMCGWMDFGICEAVAGCGWMEDGAVRRVLVRFGRRTGGSVTEIAGGTTVGAGAS
jgi:hypothetical protein